MRTHLIHRPARDIIPPLGGARVSFYWIRCCTVFYAVAAVACSRVQRNSVPSTHMRCMITANRRAKKPLNARGGAPASRAARRSLLPRTSWSGTASASGKSLLRPFESGARTSRHKPSIVPKHLQLATDARPTQASTRLDTATGWRAVFHLPA